MKESSRGKSINSDLQRCFDLANEIGIDVEIVPGATGFIQGVRIEAGRMQVCPSAPTSNFLHELGHLAILPAEVRNRFNVDARSVEDCLEELFNGAEVDSPLSRACLQASDPEATAWAWAAGIHLGLDERSIIADGEYDGDGSTIRSLLKAKQYLGINGLVHGGMALPPRSLGGYPRLLKWVQPNFGMAEPAPSMP